MPAYEVTWTQAAIAVGVVRSGPKPGAADAVALQRSLERNPHLRDAVLRLYATRRP